jgi:hypothetical protein
MTLENKNTEGSPVKEASNQEEIKLSQEQPQDAKKISVDIGGGVSVELDIEQGKKWIQYRDSKTKGYRELETKLKSAEEAAKQEKSRAELLEAIKKQSVEEVEAMASKKYVDKLEKIQSKVVAKEIESALLSNDDFLKDSKEDAIKLLKAEHTFQVNDEGDKVVTKDGKEVNEVVKEWLSKKDIFRKAKGVTSTGAKLQGGKTPPVVARKEAGENMSKGLGKLFGQ